jgi:hypothetical protein
LLGYGIEANHFPIYCERLLKAMSKMRFAKNPPRGITITYEQAKAITREALEAGDVSTAVVQALQYECFLRQIDIVGKWRVEPTSYVLKPGEIRRGKKVWHGMTLGMILNDEKLLRVRTSKTAQFVAHAVEKCELVMMCLEKLDLVDADQPVAFRADIRVGRQAQHIAKAAQMIRHHAMTAVAEGGQLAGLLIAKILVGAVVNLERTIRAVVIAKTAAKARGLQFR